MAGKASAEGHAQGGCEARQAGLGPRAKPLAKLSRWRRARALRARALLVVCLGFACGDLQALPTGNQTVAGNATVTTSTPSSMVINQGSQNAVINWQGFGIGNGESVVFKQPNASAVALNRVLGNNPSEIYGSLSANGQVFLVNPNGILFGPTASIDVGGLVASTLGIANGDFMAGKLGFANGGTAGSIRNFGQLTANGGGNSGGFIALVAPDVSNAGTITAGNVALAAGNKVTLDFFGDNLLKVKVDEAALNAHIANSGALIGDGGQVVLSAQAAGDLTGSVINQSGVIRAKSLADKNGAIVLDGGSTGTVTVSGSLDASGSQATGGSIGVFGQNIALKGASLTASGQTGGGTVLVGGDSHGAQAQVAGTTVANAQTVSIDAASTISADATVQGNGGKVVAWSDNNTRFDGSISAKGGATGGDGGFVETSGAQLKVGEQAKVTTLAANGKAGTWLLDPNDFTIVSVGGDITGATLSGNLNGGDIQIQSSAGAGGSSGAINVNDAVSWSSHTLTLTAQNNINLNTSLNGSGTASLTLEYGQGAVAAGNNSIYAVNAAVNLPTGNHFNTKLGSNGGTDNYYVINSLGLEGSTTGTDLQGMSGSRAGKYALGSNIDASATSGWTNGFLPVGDNATKFTGKFDGLGHTVSNLTINRPAMSYVGLFGWASGATLRNVGLVGGSITGSSNVGGLAGYLDTSSIVNDSYATASVSGSSYVGGLVGKDVGSLITRAYAGGNVIGAANFVGGLIGQGGGTYTDVYASGSVTGNWDVGGLVGSLVGDIVRGYARGAVNGNLLFGGLVGNNAGGSVTNSLWDKTTTGQAHDAIAADADGRLTAVMKTGATFSGKGWSLPGTWSIVEGASYPYLTALTQLVSGNAGASGKPIKAVADGKDLGSATSDGTGFYYYLLPANTVPSGKTLLTFVTGDAMKGGSAYGSTGANITSLDIASGDFNVAGGAVSNSSLVTAKGSLVIADYPYSVAGNDLTTTNSLNFKTAAAATYTLDGNLTAKSFTLASPVTMGSDATLTASNGGIAINGALSGAHALTLTATDTISQSASITATTLTAKTTKDGGAAITLTDSGNEVATVDLRARNAADNANAAGAISYRDATGFDVAAAQTTSTVTLTAGGAITQSGAMAATTLTASGTSVTLNNGSNTIDTLGTVSSSAGPINIADSAGGLTITGPVTATGGTLTVGTTGDLNINGTVDSGASAMSLTTTTSGNINVNTALPWTNHLLTLTAANDINLNAVMTATNASLVLTPASTKVNAALSAGGFTGRVDFFQADGVTPRSGTGFLTIGGNGYTVLTSVGADYTSVTGTDLQGMNGGPNGGLAGYYALGANIDAGATSSWNSNLGFMPVGTSGSKFTGSFNGLGHTIGNLVIRGRFSGLSNAGLFGYTNGAKVSNVGMVGGSVSGINQVGELIGNSNSTTITNAFATGSVSASNNGGGLVGANTSGSITNAYATGSVSLTGGGNAVGGLVGWDDGGTISKAYATGNVSGGTAWYLGGLIGQSVDPATYTNVYATGNVSGGSGSWFLGGLMGMNQGTVSYAYASGYVSGDGATGGLAGTNAGTINTTNNFWDTQTTGQANSIGQGTGSGSAVGGKTTALMRAAATFNGAAGWSLPGTWSIVEGVSYPYLTSFFATPPQIITGSTSAAGQAVQAVANGVALGSTGSGANNAYYFALPAGTVANGQTLVTYVPSTGAAAYGSTGVNISGLDITSGTFNVNLSNGAVSNSSLVTAKGALAPTGFPYTVSGNNLTTSLAFNTAGAAPYTLDGNITAQSETLASPVTLGADATLSATAGGIAINGALDGAHALTLTATGAVSQNAAITNVTTLSASGSSVTLNNGGNTIASLGTTSSSAGAINILDSAGGLTVTGNVTATGGALALSTAGSLTVNGTVSSSSDNMSLTATGGTSDIALNSAINWSTNKTLTVTAGRDINVNASMAASGDTAGLVLAPTRTYNLNNGTHIDLTGTAPSLTIATVPYTVINTHSAGGGLGLENSATVTDLQGMKNGLAGKYALGSNIDAAATSGWTGGFLPVGTSATKFTGKFDGLGHTISNLNINRPTIDNVGLFGYANGATVRNVGLVGGSITGRNYVGGLAGYSNGSITDAYVTANVSGDPTSGSNIGGLVGQDQNGTITRAYASGNVSGGTSNPATSVGGLVGSESGFGSYTDVYATGSVTGYNKVGGLIGSSSGDILRGYASGHVTGSTNVGGLVGYLTGTVTNSFYDNQAGYATDPADGLGVKGMATADMKLQGNFTGPTAANGMVNPNWNFTPTTGVWTINAGGYPCLVGLPCAAATTPVYLRLITGGSSVYGSAPSFAYGLYTTAAAGSIVADAGDTGTVVWSGAPSVPTSGSSAGTYALTYSSGINLSNSAYTLSAGNAVNWTVTKAPLTVTANADAKTYNGLAYSGGHGVTYSAFANGENSGVLGGTLGYAGSSQGAINAGSYAITPNGLTSGNYSFTYVDGTLTVNKAPLTITAQPNSKTYDGTTSAAAVPTVAGLQNLDTVTGKVETYDNRNVGNPKTLTVSAYTVNDGNGGNNYTVSTVADGTGVITTRPITVTAQTETKVYDGTTASSVLPTITVGSLGAGDTSPGLTQTFDTRNVGITKTLTPSGVVNDGNSGNNYAVTYANNGTGVISTRGLTLTAQTNTKTYDGTISAAAIPTVAGLQPGDTVTGKAETYDNANAGSGKTLSVSAYTVNDGNGGNNYAVSTFANMTGVINAAVVVPGVTAVSAGVTAANKVYDGTTAATITSRTLQGVIGNDDVSLTGGTATFDNKNVGNNKTVTAINLSLAGSAAGNYSANTTATTTADITPKPVTASVTAANKVYDATTAAELTSRTLSGVVAGDAVSLAGGTANFADKNVGTAKTVTATGLALLGNDAGNYTANSTATTTADITPASLIATLTAGITAANKVYDGTTAATITGRSLQGVVGNDDVSLTGGTATFDNKNVGSGKTVTAINLALAGSAAGNYSANTTATTTADITPKPVTASVTAASKVYDATTAADITSRTLNGVIIGDAVILVGGTASFADPNVGTAKPVTATGLGLTGHDAGNYTANSTATTAADITPASLVVSVTALTAGVTAANKVYDGTTAATITSRSLQGVIGNDDVSLVGGSANFDNKNVGTGKTVTAIDLALAGAKAGNYSANTTATTTADITPRPVTASVTAASKVYDATTAAEITSRTLGGVIPGDAVSLVGGTANFADKNVGTAKTVTATGLALTGNDAGNYSNPATTATTSADITPKGLVINGLAAADKVYDATTAATLNGGALIGIVGGDAVSLTVGTGAFADKNVGTAKTVTVSGTHLNGADAGNYSVITPSGLTASITARGLTLVADDKEKLIGTADPALTYQIKGDGLIAGDTLNGALTRVAGETVADSPYAITQGSLANSNYAIAFNNGALTINPLPVVIPPAPVVAFMPIPTFREDKKNEDNFLLESYPSYRVDMRNEAISDQTLTKSLYEVQNGGINMPRLERVASGR